jgi:4'-phosphopantetheinyl transferase EntD
MPVVKTIKINEKSAYAIWKVTEGIDELKSLANEVPNLNLPDKDISNEIKQIEWIAGRLLLASLVIDRGYAYHGIYKDEFGKPFLKDNHCQISLSHSYPFVVAIIHEDQAVGIDVEQPKDKILRIAPKFLSEEEQVSCGDDISLLCTYWCAKEALYKLYGKKKLIFKEHLAVDYRRFHGENLLFGKVIVNGASSRHALQVEKIGDSLIVFTK